MSDFDHDRLLIAYILGMEVGSDKRRALVERVRERCAQTAEAYEPRCDTCPAGVATAIRSIPIDELMK